MGRLGRTSKCLWFGFVLFGDFICILWNFYLSSPSCLPLLVPHKQMMLIKWMLQMWGSLKSGFHSYCPLPLDRLECFKDLRWGLWSGWADWMTCWEEHAASQPCVPTAPLEPDWVSHWPITKQGKKRWLVFCQPSKLNLLTKEAGECQNWCKEEGRTTLWGGRKGGQADLVATSCEVSSATDLSVVLAEVSVVGWRAASYANHSQESWCGFSWGVVNERGV